MLNNTLDIRNSLMSVTDMAMGMMMMRCRQSRG